MTRLVVPDAIHHTDPAESLEYITGWNDCRQAMLAEPAQQGPVGEVNRYGLDSHGRKWHCIHWYDPNVDVPHGTKLYTTPQTQSAQPEHHDPIGEAQDKLIAEQALAHCEAGPEYCQQCYKEAMKLALKALEPFTTPNWAGTGVDEANAAYTALQGALAKQPAPVQEPFGYFKAEPFGWTDCAETDEGAIALYTTPQAQPAQRKPLTDAEMDNCLRRAGVIATLEALRCVGREVEAAHGIKEKT